MATNGRRSSCWQESPMQPPLIPTSMDPTLATTMDPRSPPPWILALRHRRPGILAKFSTADPDSPCVRRDPGAAPPVRASSSQPSATTATGPRATTVSICSPDLSRHQWLDNDLAGADALEFDEEALAAVDGKSARKAWCWRQPVATAGWRCSTPVDASFDAPALRHRTYPTHAAAQCSARPFASLPLEWVLPQNVFTMVQS